MLVSGNDLTPALAERIARVLMRERASGRYEVLGLLASRDAASEIIALLPQDEDWICVEVGVPPVEAMEILSKAQEGGWGALCLLERRAPCDPSLFTLGYEIVGDDWHHLHSWLCNHLDEDANDRLGITPGRLGLLQSLAEARAVAELINAEEFGEPVDWRPIRLSVEATLARRLLERAD